MAHDFYAIKSNGERIKLNRNDFSPYDTIFTQNRFYYLSNDNTFANTYGALLKDTLLCSNEYKSPLKYIKNRFSSKWKRSTNSYEMYSEIENAKNLEEIRSLLLKYGVNKYNDKRVLTLKEFIKTYFINYNKVESKHSFYHMFGAPYHIYDLSAKRLQGGENIKKIEVYKTNTWWNKEESQIVKFDTNKIMEIDIETN